MKLIPFADQDKDVRPRNVARMRYDVPPFDPDVAAEVLESLALGRRITAIGSTPGLPAYWVINCWRSMVPEFDELVVQASEAGAEKMLWDTLEIADSTDRSPGCREVSIKARLHAMKVLNRKRFDPAVKVDLGVSRTNPDDLTDAELAQIVRRQGMGVKELRRMVDGEGE